MSKLLYYAAQPKILLLGILLLVALYIVYRLLKVRRKRAAPQRGVMRLNLDDASPSEPTLTEPAGETVEPAEPAVPSFQTLQKPPSLFSDLAHAGLIVLAVIVAAGFLLVLIPQSSFDRMTQNLQDRQAGAKPEQIGFLYLGDEIKDKEFHVRGVVRNITDQPMEQIDAAVRLYAPDGRLLQTAVVRMDKETIAPDETAEFHLVYPNYEQNIGSYSVDFRSRQGQIVNYKDMRTAARPRSQP